MQPPQCASCGAIVTNPSATQCTYCGSALRPGVAPAYGGPPGHGVPPAHGYGQAPPYAQPPHGQAPYGQAPFGQAPYGQPPYAPPPVAGFNGVPVHGFRGPTGGGGFWGTVGTIGNVFWWIRIGIAVFVLGLVLLGSCVSALSH